jgi:hypothetical protein
MIYEQVENSVPGTSQEAKAKALEAFLVSAEGRYMQYLAILDNVAKKLKRNHQQYSVDLNQEIPLPPWYVLSWV